MNRLQAATGALTLFLLLSHYPINLSPHWGIRTASPSTTRLSWSCPNKQLRKDYSRHWGVSSIPAVRVGVYLITPLLFLNSKPTMITPPLLMSPQLSIALAGEATHTPYFLLRLLHTMQSDPTGRLLLRHRPQVSIPSLGYPANYMQSGCIRNTFPLSPTIPPHHGTCIRPAPVP